MLKIPKSLGRNPDTTDKYSPAQTLPEPNTTRLWISEGIRSPNTPENNMHNLHMFTWSRPPDSPRQNSITRTDEPRNERRSRRAW